MRIRYPFAGMSKFYEYMVSACSRYPDLVADSPTFFR